MALEVLQHNIGEVEATATEALDDLIEEEEEGKLTTCYWDPVVTIFLQSLKRRRNHLPHQVCHQLRIKTMLLLY